MPEWGTGFDVALGYYQQALIYALRFNRFLLDEALWGGGVRVRSEPGAGTTVTLLFRDPVAG